MNQFYTAESVTEGHPDEAVRPHSRQCIGRMPFSRRPFPCGLRGAATEQIIVAGEITSLFEPRIPAIARSVLQKAGYDPARYAIQCLVHKQSPDITAGVDCSLERRRNPQ